MSGAARSRPIAAPVLVATDAEAVRDAILEAGGEALMTRPDHPSGSDRVFEAVLGRDPDAQA